MYNYNISSILVGLYIIITSPLKFHGKRQDFNTPESARRIPELPIKCSRLLDLTRPYLLPPKMTL